MARTFIKDLKGGENLQDFYVLRQCDLLKTRTDKMYMAMSLGDMSGNIQARLWDATDLTFEQVRDADIVKVQGGVEIYRNQMQVVVARIRPAQVDEADLAELLPHTQRDIDKMMDELLKAAKSIKDPHLKSLLEAFLADDEICQGFRRSPGAVTYHHAYIGGLLEHTVTMLGVMEKIVPCYPALDRDLLAVGIILHDVGKIRELDCGAKFSYTDAGQLLGHIILGVTMVDEKVKDIAGFPPELLLKLKHLILSHHGEYEFVSPKLPMTIESVALHHLDNLDAKLTSFAAAVESEAEGEGKWTQWNKMFNRRLYFG